MMPVRGAKGGLRSRVPPWGVFGGRPARSGNLWVNGVEISDRAREVALKPGDLVRVDMNAGGGYGNPLDRDPELVLGDVLDGYVTLEGAREDYGVVIDPRTLTIDPAATRALRDERRGR